MHKAMKIKNFTPGILMLFCAAYGIADIPEWYREAVGKFVIASTAIILYEPASLELVREEGPYKFYKIEVENIEVLKGEFEGKPCFYFQTEGEYPGLEELKKESHIVILNKLNKAGCNYIETGLSAPGTKEYIELFKKVIEKSA